MVFRHAGLCVLLLAAASLANEVYRPVMAPAKNQLANPDFEQPGEGGLSGWSGYQAGYQPAAGEGRGGSQAARCERRTDAEPGAGTTQLLRLNQRVALPIVVTGWSRADHVTGSPDSNYSLYCDLEYTDGTPLWGQVYTFTTGTHDWQRGTVVISPAKPVKSVSVYGLFRGHLGRVWFDDFSLAELGGGLKLLDGVAVDPVKQTAAPDTASTAGRLEVGWSGSRVGRVRLGGEVVTGAWPGGFLARDVAAESGFHDFPGPECPALGLALDFTTRTEGEALVIEGHLRDTTGRPRAVTLLFGLPLAAEGWDWWHSPQDASKIAAPANYGDWNRIGVGSNGALSRWPLACLSGAAGAVALGIDMKAPAQYRLGYSGATQLLYVAFDYGLTPLTRRAPSTAAFRFVVYPTRRDWGFRAALADYYRLFPDSFRMRTPDQGNWMAFAKTSQVEHWEDFGLKIKEGDNETAWDNAHGLLTFRYSEMGTYWLTMPPAMPREADQAVGLLRQNAATGRADVKQWAEATLNSGMHDREGRLNMLFKKEPWCDGCVFSLNPSPYLTKFSQAQICWGPERQKAYEPGVKAQLAGEYLDSLEGYVTADLNFREEHLAAAVFPPTFTLDDRRPVLHKAFSIGEFVQYLADDLHRRGRLTMANGTPYSYSFLDAWLDVMGTETNWMDQQDRWRPVDDETLLLWRSMAAQRPYLLLMNTRFGPFGQYMERYFQRALAYGLFPSMFSHNASEDHYFTKPEWYNRDRELFRRYMPQIKAVAEEGWQPVTGARCDNARIVVERFGPGRTKTVFLTVHNPTDEPQSGTLTGDDVLLGRPLPAREVKLQPWATVVVKP